MPAHPRQILTPSTQNHRPTTPSKSVFTAKKTPPSSLPATYLFYLTKDRLASIFQPVTTLVQQSSEDLPADPQQSDFDHHQDHQHSQGGFLASEFQ